MFTTITKKHVHIVSTNSRSCQFNEKELEKWKLNQVHVMMLHSCGKHDRNPFLMQIRPLQRWSLNSLWYICNIKKNISKKMAKTRFFGIHSIIRDIAPCYISKMNYTSWYFYSRLILENINQTLNTIQSVTRASIDYKTTLLPLADFIA